MSIELFGLRCRQKRESCAARGATKSRRTQRQRSANRAQLSAVDWCRARGPWLAVPLPAGMASPTRPRAQTQRGSRCKPAKQLQYDPERSTRHCALHTVVDVSKSAEFMSLRSARFSFSPALEPYSPLKARPLPVTGCTPATSRKRREDTRRFGAKGTAKGQVNKYSTSQLQRAWDATAAYKGTAACKLGNTLLNRGSDVSQLVKPWERVDVWRGWLLTDAAMHGNDGFGSNGGTRATTPGGRGKSVALAEAAAQMQGPKNASDAIPSRAQPRPVRL